MARQYPFVAVRVQSMQTSDARGGHHILLLEPGFTAEEGLVKAELRLRGREELVGR